MEADDKKQYATPEQLVYANILEAGMRIGFVLLIVTFALYVFGVIPPQIPLTEISNYWCMSAEEYLQAAHLPTGWGWVNLLGKGDMLNFIGIAFLSTVTIFCFIRILPILFKKKDMVYGVIVLAEVLVLILAASGILQVGE
ncbi:MAG: hypothetical protein QME42_10835 [bacterium]|nr:hypothetical protein [bacterium]